MERLLHYAWQNKLFPIGELHTTDGQTLEVINTGLHNTDSGPDFINCTIKLDGVEFAGNVEVHTKSSDWNRHGHDKDAKYGNIILHVVSVADTEVKDVHGRTLPQFVMQVPQYVEENYTQLLVEEKYPPCYRYAARLDSIKIRSWLSTLHIERLEEKTNRIFGYLDRCNGDWNRVCFIAIARNFGFGINGEAFEQWAFNVPLLAAAKHRDNILQLEALFFGQAGLLLDSTLPRNFRDLAEYDDHFLNLKKEYKFLANKFSLKPMAGEQWRLLRTRPQNFPDSENRSGRPEPHTPQPGNRSYGILENTLHLRLQKPGKRKTHSAEIAEPYCAQLGNTVAFCLREIPRREQVREPRPRPLYPAAARRQLHHPHMGRNGDKGTIGRRFPSSHTFAAELLRTPRLPALPFRFRVPYKVS